MCWNPALDLFINVKIDFINEYGEESLWTYGHEDSYTDCLSYWIDSLEKRHHPHAEQYSKMVDPLVLNESMGMLLIRYGDLGIDWDAYNGLYQECRSVVIDVLTDELILVPFRKFFNIGEREETQLAVVQQKMENSSRIEITDKIDGSMCSARWYKGDFILSGSRALEAEKSFRLENYYRWMSQHEQAVQMLKDYSDYTFVFEGVFPDDMHVVRYDESMTGLHLLGMRRVYDGKELPYYKVVEVAEKYAVPHVKIFNITFEEAYQDALNNGRKADEGEGYVIDVDGQKYKLKYNDYVKIHKAICKMVSPNAIIAAIRDGYWDDFYSKIPLAYQPQAKEVADNVYKYIEVFNSYVVKWYESDDLVNSRDDRKTFMIAVDRIVPQQYRGAVRSKYLMKDIDYLKGVKYNDILSYLESVQALTLKIKN
jgi:hypothetical protein